MKKNIFIYILVTVTALIMISRAYALDIEGWWRATMTMDYADFPTGEWQIIRATGKNTSYLYFSNIQEYTYSGIGYLVLYDGSDGYYLNIAPPGYYTVYLRNNIAVLFIQSGLFDENQASGSTIILRLVGSGNTSQLKGFYTEYDIENTGTPEQFIRMGPISATRVNVQMVPDDAKKLIP
jgi:hypothetical protein